MRRKHSIPTDTATAALQAYRLAKALVYLSNMGAEVNNRGLRRLGKELGFGCSED
jgi:hypothetical protein